MDTNGKPENYGRMSVAEKAVWHIEDRWRIDVLLCEGREVKQTVSLLMRRREYHDDMIEVLMPQLPAPKFTREQWMAAALSGVVGITAGTVPSDETIRALCARYADAMTAGSEGE